MPGKGIAPGGNWYVLPELVGTALELPGCDIWEFIFWLILFVADMFADKFPAVDRFCKCIDEAVGWDIAETGLLWPKPECTPLGSADTDAVADIIGFGVGESGDIPPMWSETKWMNNVL